MSIYMWREVIAGIYHDEVNGLISLSSDGTNWITIADKNLGATSYDTSSSDSYGKFYQRGNNYGFSYGTQGSTSSSKVNASSYNWQNPYSSSTFIKQQQWMSNMSSGSTTDLRGETTDTVAARQGPCSSGYHIPNNTDWNSLISVMTSLGVYDSSNPTNFYTYLKIPLPGYINYSSASVNWSGWFAALLGTTREYWYASYAMIIRANSAYGTNQLKLEYIDNGGGYNIRPFKNTPVQPDETRTVLYQ